MRAMRTYAKKKECVNAPVGPFTMFSHCVYGYNVRKELISAAKNTEHQYQYDELDSLASDGGVAYAYDAAGNRTTKTENGETIAYTLGLSDGLASWMSLLLLLGVGAMTHCLLRKKRVGIDLYITLSNRRQGFVIRRCWNVKACNSKFYLVVAGNCA